MTDFSIIGRATEASVETALADLNLAAYLLAARKQLGMDVAFIGEFAKGRRVFRYVDSDETACPVMVGASDPLEATYCQRVTDGRLPAVIRDAQEYPAAAALAVTDDLAIGSYLGVPLRLESGEIFGTFCCFSHGVAPALDGSALATMRMFGEMVAGELEGVLRKRVLQVEQGERIETVLRDGQLALHYQPVYRLWQQEISGFECLARFPEPPHKRTDVWFAEADEVGLGTALELAAIRQGLAAMQRLPGGFDVHVNASPGLVMSGVLDEALLDANLARLVLEVTEHEPVADYEAFLGMLTPLRRRGLRLAVDDAGAGHATLRHILKLRPDIIKLDISLIRNINEDKYKSALAAALIRFALETEVEIVAEGIETVGEFNHLRALGAQGGQGNYLGRPLTLAQALTLVCESDAGVAAV